MRCIFGSPAARPCSIVGRGGLGTLSLHIYPSFFSVGVSNTLLEFLILQPSFFPRSLSVLSCAGLLPFWCLTRGVYLQAGGVLLRDLRRAGGFPAGRIFGGPALGTPSPYIYPSFVSVFDSLIFFPPFCLDRNLSACLPGASLGGIAPDLRRDDRSSAGRQRAPAGLLGLFLHSS